MNKVSGQIFQAVENSSGTVWSPLQVSLSCFNRERKRSNRYSPLLSFLLFAFADWPHGQCNQANLYKVGFRWRLHGAVARFFVTGGEGGHYRECRRHEPCRGASGCPRPENFQVWRLQNASYGFGKIDVSRVSTHVFFTRVKKIEAMYWRSRVNVKAHKARKVKGT